MISVDSLLYKIDQRLNKLATNQHQAIQLEDKILALQEAEISLIKKKVDPNNIYKIGLDGFKKRYQDLQFLAENFEDHKLKPKLTDKNLNKYTATISDITPKFMFYIDSYVLADKGECKNKILYTNLDLVKHADITLLLNNNNYKPSFEYRETLVDISTDEINVYSDGTFTPHSLYLSYVRYPKPVDKEGYTRFDGTESTNQDSELEAYLEDELLNLVYRDLGIYTENPSAVQGAEIKMNTEE